MIYTEMTKKGLKLCFEAHKEQIDKSGMPYVFHPFHLAEQMQDEESTIVALLHDVIEDTDYLRKVGFDDSVLTAINLMTYEDGVPYMDYVEQIKTNPIAITVKLADLQHNSGMTRLEVVTPRDQERAEKYLAAIKLLEQ